MSDTNHQFTGKWLHTGERQGKDFSHDRAEFEHAEQIGTEATKMRHATIEQEGRTVDVWVPDNWTDDQVKEALTTQW